MKVSYNWLKDYLDIDKPVDEVSEILTNLGLEVEKVEDFESIKGSLEGIIVGEVLSCKKHPNADRLKLTNIDLGEKGKFEIVCGAPNIEKGQKVPVATIGSVIYTNSGEKIKILKSKIRGVVSNGMVCAEDEIGLGESHDGIMVLDKKIKSGTPLSEVYKIEKDKIIQSFLNKEYFCYMTGFIAGMPFLGDINKDIRTERLETPRVKVPKGAVGITEQFCNIYTFESPGGWNIIGNTPINIFNKNNKINPALINPGDKVSFYKITSEEYYNWNDKK